MSKITYKLSDLATKEQILWFNELQNKIECCGNDCLIIENDFSLNINIIPILAFIEKLHLTSNEKEFLVNYYKTFIY